jgi:hypothetical protein
MFHTSNYALLPGEKRNHENFGVAEKMRRVAQILNSAFRKVSKDA